MYSEIRSLIENGQQTSMFLNVLNTLLLKYGLDPYYRYSDGKTLFEVCVVNECYLVMNLFILFWLSNPNYNLFDEIYKLEKKKDVLEKVISFVDMYKSSDTIVNQLMNIVYVFVRI